MTKGERGLSDWLAQGYATTPAAGNGTTPADDAEPPLTDRGNGQRFAQEHLGRVRYEPRVLKAYLVWDGQRFARDVSGSLVMPLAKATARRHLDRVLAAAALDKARLKWWSYAESLPGLRRLAELAQSEPGIPVRYDDLDAHPFLLNTASGIVEQTTGTQRPHDPAHLLTRLTPVGYDPEAPCEQFLAFARRILADRDDLLAYVQQALGMATTGKSDRVLLVFHGAGHNGKTTLVNIVRGVLGDDYTAACPADTVLVKRRDGGIPNDLARLAGRRLVHVAELEGRRLAEGLIKQLTGGGEKVPARFLHGEYFEHVADYTLLMTCNKPPRITGTDNAIWERVHLVPFDVVIPPSERERDLAERLVREEGPGILRWLIEGAVTWHAAGRLQPPPVVVAATQRYRDEQDALRPFLTERCALEATGRVSVADLYASYSGWAKDSGETPISKAELRRVLLARGFPDPVRGGHGGGRVWHGLRLKAGDEPEPAPALTPSGAQDVTLWS